MPENNVAEKYWLNNKQVAGAFVMFILLGVGYGEFRGMQANDEIQDLEIKLLKEDADEEEQEMKSLIYTKAREGTEKTTRMIEPLRKDVSEIMAWKNFTEGYNKAQKEFNK